MILCNLKVALCAITGGAIWRGLIACAVRTAISVWLSAISNLRAKIRSSLMATARDFCDGSPCSLTRTDIARPRYGFQSGSRQPISEMAAQNHRNFIPSRKLIHIYGAVSYLSV